MKKSYTKPVIELVEYATDDVIMVSVQSLDNDQAWLASWSVNSASLSDSLK